MQCPRCHEGELAFDPDSGTMRCAACGFRLFEDSLDDVPAPPPDPPATPQIQPLQAPAPTPARPAVQINLPSRMDFTDIPADSDYERTRVRGRCEDALFAISRKDYNAACQALRSALQLSPEYDQPWLFLAGLTQDGSEQREYLEHALATNPKNMIALEALARLDGRLDDTASPSDQSLEPGQVAAQSLTCPNCKGRIVYDVGQREVTCYHCGHRILDVGNMARTGSHTVLAIGLLKRKRKSATWNIGARWARCKECGAATTVPKSSLTNTCRFCGSSHVLQEGINHQFEQPDLIMPFSVTEKMAEAAIEKALRSGIRRITRFFADAIDRVMLHAVYAPFWIFDADMIVNWSWTNAPDHGKHPVLLSDVPFLAADTPSRKLTRKLEPFDIRRSVDYDPRLLATHPAELYTIDIDRASLDVRRKLQKLAERKAEPGIRIRRPSRGHSGDDDPGRLVMNTNTEHMTYRLALLPIWIGLLVEEDGDTRQVLVNGQTGKATLGKLQKRVDKK